MYYSQEHYNLLQLPTRFLNVKIDLLNENEVVVSSLEGISIDGSLDIKADSTYRRTGNLKMILNNNNLIPKPDSKIWFNKKCRIWIGLKDYNDEIYWFNFGKYAMSEVNLNFTQIEKTLETNLLDLTSTIDGIISGHLSNPVKLLAEDNIPIKEAIKSTIITLGKINKVSIDYVKILNTTTGLYEDPLIPYDIIKDPNSTVYDLIKELVELYKGYEFFFDIDGYFKVQKIKDTKNDTIIWDFTEDSKNLIINYNSKINFSNVNNSITIWGKKMDDGSQAKWTYRNRYSRNTISERDLITDKIKGDICHVIDENKSYMWNDIAWELLNFTVIPIFNIENIGEKIWAINDDKIFNNDQARIRCEYELWLHSNFAEQINFSCIPIYLLDVNKKIKLKVDELGINGDYRIDSINVPLTIDGNMNVSASKIYY